MLVYQSAHKKKQNSESPWLLPLSFVILDLLSTGMSVTTAIKAC